MYKQTKEERLKMLRYNLMIHSYLYYTLNVNLISDYMFDKMSSDLVELQKEIKEIGFYDKEFSDWDGSTGYHLPKDERVINKAMQLLRWSLKNEH